MCETPVLIQFLFCVMGYTAWPASSSPCLIVIMPSGTSAG